MGYYKKKKKLIRKELMKYIFNFEFKRNNFKAKKISKLFKEKKKLKKN